MLMWQLRGVMINETGVQKRRLSARKREGEMDAVEKSLRIGGCGRMCKHRRIVGRVGRVLVAMHRESGTQIWIDHNTATQPKEKPIGE